MTWPAYSRANEYIAGHTFGRQKIASGSVALDNKELNLSSPRAAIGAGLDSAFANHMDDMVDDIPKYTNIEPIAQIEKIV
ncbi:MAG: hypothetical protein QF449_12500 [Alphaproteobacteria bacterium]|nr:hypothetical protein [Alphaproteobacteria bacterium]MDP6588252.1 hypothetical protein [Alphaproteobacteria bacterium]MDP6818849.1 hypothetical protein [Alphaproteobacteria bacterium]